MKERALVLFSGGQDSTTCLAWALSRYKHVETIGFDYRQRHSIELECREEIFESIRATFPDWSTILKEDHVLDLELLSKLSETALTRDKAIELSTSGLPNTFVPGRNLLFLTYAAIVAFRRGLDVLVGGMCETDYSGYPDCRDTTLKALAVSLNLGMNTNCVIETPLMWLTKSETWKLADDLGGQALIDIIVDKSHTCYLGDRSKVEVWGRGCGTCPACVLRADGYNKFVTDKAA